MTETTTTTRRAGERALPFLVVLVMVGLALVVVFLLDGAVDDGRDALEASLVSEVQAVARNQDQRLAATLGSTAGLASQPFELTEGSQADLGELEDLLELIPDLRTGFFLVDGEGTITQGVQLLDADRAIGERYERSGFDELVASPRFAQGIGGILEVESGITTASPTLAIVFPVLDRTTGERRGAFVFESEVAPDSDLNEEISNLGKGETGRYLFYDRNGAVLAASDPALFDRPITEPELLTGPVGLLEHPLDGDIVVLAEVPTAGWRIAFRQDVDEFESDLAGPIQTVGSVVVVVLLVIGAASGVLLLRRLQAAREEQARLQRLAESQEEFVSIVSHELRTPVAGVLGFLQTTLDHWDDMAEPERRSAVHRAAGNARRLQGLARDVLDSESLAAGRMAFSFGPVDLKAEVQEAAEVARDVLPERTIAVELPDEPMDITGDADRIQQVLTNLLDNAAQNSPAGEPIELRLAVVDRAAVLTVTDHGPGLPPEVADRVFDRFVRGRLDRIGGTGLGLYIVRSIVEAHRGTVEVASAPGQGATFTVKLPLS
jgi:signal transduction histidine kinase